MAELQAEDSGNACLASQLIRPDAVETLRAVRRLRVGELELAGKNFRDAAQGGPVAQRQ